MRVNKLNLLFNAYIIKIMITLNIYLIKFNMLLDGSYATNDAFYNFYLKRNTYYAFCFVVLIKQVNSWYNANWFQELKIFIRKLLNNIKFNNEINNLCQNLKKKNFTIIWKSF